MELNHSKSSIVKNNVTGIPISSAEYEFLYKSSSKALLPDPASQYRVLSCRSEHRSKFRQCGANSVIAKIGESVDMLAQGIREHVRLGPKLSETVKGKLSLGAIILQVGGVEKVFKQKFNIGDDNEKLLKASQCYLSTTAGPIAGLLFISNNRVAFCSERSIKVTSPTGKLVKVHYKVMIPLRNIKRAIETENARKPTQKYIQLVTEDNFEFWFMGFLKHHKTFKYLDRAIHQDR